MAQEYEQPVDSVTSPRSQRMTAEESRAVIALWQQERVEQTGLTDRPAVPDVAEGLDITVEDVQRLLLEVRARRQHEERALAAEQELSEVRVAEEDRRLAEVQRQRAELQRQQAEAQQEQIGELGQTEQALYVRRKQAASPIAAIIGLIVFILWICFIVALAGNHGDSPFSSSPAASDCAITGPDGKPQPCSPEMKAFIENGINQQTHRGSN